MADYWDEFYKGILPLAGQQPVQPPTEVMVPGGPTPWTGFGAGGTIPDAFRLVPDASGNAASRAIAGVAGGPMFPPLASQFDPQQVAAYNARFKPTPMLPKVPMGLSFADKFSNAIAMRGLDRPGRGGPRPLTFGGGNRVTVGGGVPTVPPPLTTRVGTNGYIYAQNPQGGWTQVGKTPQLQSQMAAASSNEAKLREGGGYYKSPGTGTGGSLISG